MPSQPDSSTPPDYHADSGRATVHDMAGRDERDDIEPGGGYDDMY